MNCADAIGLYRLCPYIVGPLAERRAALQALRKLLVEPEGK